MLTKPQKEFDQIFRKYGGIISESIADSSWYTFIKYNTSLYLEWLKSRYPTLPEIYVDFIDSPYLNACVSRNTEGNYFIGVNAGSVLMIIDFFDAALGTKGAFKSIGNHELESNEQRLLNIAIERTFTDSGALTERITLSDRTNDRSIPVDPQRTDAIFYLTYQTIQFLILHEVGHLVRGHVDFATALLKDLYWNEFAVPNVTKHSLEPLLSQTLEMDADSFAINNSIIIAEAWINEPDRRNNVKFDVYKKFLNFFYQDWNTFYQNWVHAVYAFFRLCYYKKVQDSDRLLGSHPSPMSRIQMLLANIATIELEHRSQTIEQHVDITNESALETEYAFSLVTFGDIGHDALSSYNDSNNLEYMFLLVENYKVIKHQLEPYSFPFILQNP